MEKGRVKGAPQRWTRSRRQELPPQPSERAPPCRRPAAPKRSFRTRLLRQTLLAKSSPCPGTDQSKPVDVACATKISARRRQGHREPPSFSGSHESFHSACRLSRGRILTHEAGSFHREVGGRVTASAASLRMRLAMSLSDSDLVRLTLCDSATILQGSSPEPPSCRPSRCAGSSPPGHPESPTA